MKQLTLSFIFCLFSFVSISQTIQRGYILEYKGKDKKTPLAAVELVVRGASSTVSAKEGAFVLQFASLKPGDQAFITRLQKKGYELFNTDAVAQWHLSRTGEPFKIVMCRSDQFKKLKDTYWQVASNSYKIQYQKEQDQLVKALNEQIIKEADYQRKLSELRLFYERQLDNLDVYVEKFARYDLSELDSTEQAIIELVQNGEIELAIKKYEDMNLLEKFIKSSNEKNKAHEDQLKLDSALAVKDQTMARLRSILEMGVDLNSKSGKRVDAIRDLELLMHADPTNQEYMDLWKELCR